MRHEEKKIVKIVEELTVYFFALGADRIRTDIKRGRKEVVIQFEANYEQEYASNLSYLEEFLCGPNFLIEI